MSETVFDHLSGEETFTITAEEKWSINLITRLKEKHPDDVKILFTNEDGSLLAQIPYKWVKIRPPRYYLMKKEKLLQKD
jgi:hypothetical protein